MYILLIIVIIVLIADNSDKSTKIKKLQRENKSLKEQLRQQVVNENIENVTLKTEVKEETLYNETAPVELSKEQEEVYIKTETSVQKERLSEKELKNVAILVTGAVCIVLSAIVFLMSTWGTIPNVLKTMVLLLLTTVFFGGSYIAKNKFNIEKAGQAFFYIAMAYIPICLLSISVFELLGNYLSIFGDGKYIYLMFSFVLISIIYYYTYLKKNNEYLLYGSILSQVFSLVSFSLILSNDVILIGITLLLYNILLVTLTKKSVFEKIYNIIPAMLTCVVFFKIYERNTSMIFMMFLLAVNFLILELKNSKKEYSYMFNIIFMVSGLYALTVYKTELGTDLYHSFMIIYVLLVYIPENIFLYKQDRKYLSNSLMVTTIAAIGILHLESLYNYSIVKPYVISLIQIVLLAVTYIRGEESYKKTLSGLIPVYFILTGLNIISVFNLPYHSYIIFTFITFAMEEIFRKRDNLLYRAFFATSHIFVLLMYAFVAFKFYNEFINDVLYGILLMGMYIYSYVTTKEKYFKNFAYIALNFVLFMFVKFVAKDSNLIYYIPVVTTLIVLGIEKIYKKLQDENSTLYLGFSESIAFICLYYLGNQTSTIVTILFAVVIILCNIKNNKIGNIIPLIGTMPALFNNNLKEELRIGLMVMSVASVCMMSLGMREVSIYTVFSGIYLYFTLINVENIYLKEILFLAWSLSHMYFISKEKTKDVFKFLMYLSVVFLYNSIIREFGLDVYTAFEMLGIVVIAILTLRTIIIKYNKTDELEYLTFGLIYLFALYRYRSELDGILFGVLIIAIIFTSYIKRYGALFMTSIVSILANIFILTRKFWFSVPWWIYLLAAGSALIGFAIRNEVSDKKESINVGNMLKNMKDKIDNG